MSPSRTRRNQRRERRTVARVAIRPKFSADILAAWDHARWVWNTFCHDLFYTPADLLLREAVSQREAKEIQDWLRGMELLTRRIILAAALAIKVVLKPLAPHRHRQRKRRRVLVWPLKPRTWIVRLRMVSRRAPSARPRCTTRRPLPPVAPAFPLAKRLEAIRRVLASPERYAHRFAVKLARIAERNTKANAPRQFSLRPWPPRRMLTRGEAVILTPMQTLSPLIQAGLDRWNQAAEPG